MKRFRVYPEPGEPFYFDVRIYRTRKLYLAALGRNDRFVGMRENWENAGAVCRAFETLRLDGKKWVLLPRLGVLFFYRAKVGTEVVAHEMAHAAVYWAKKAGISGRSVWAGPKGDQYSPNERFAYAAGELNKQFWRNAQYQVMHV